MAGNALKRMPVTIDQQRLIDVASGMVQIPSENPPGNEAAVADYLTAFFAQFGIKPSVQEIAPGRPNILVRLEGEEPGPHLIFNGHTDVVPAGPGWTVDPYGGEIRDGRLYGRGSADMKAGIAAMIEAALTVYQGARFRGAITLAMVADEEEGGGGTRHAVQRGLRGDWAIIPEPTDLRPVIAHKGDFNFYITVHGQAAHGSVPDHGVNAIYGAARLMSAIQDLNARLAERSHSLVGHPTISVGTIHGGEITCMVPAICRLALDRRVIPGERPADVIDEVCEILDRLSRDDPTFKAEMDVPIQALPMELAPDQPIVSALRTATRHVIGADPGFFGWAATCDASILSEEAQTPTIIFGPGSIEQAAHRPDESVAIDEVIACAQIYVLAVLDLLGMDQ